MADRPQPSRWRTLQRVAVTLAGTLVALLMIEMTTSMAKTESPAGADRSQMVERQLEARGISHPRVLEVMRKVPRHRFVPASLRPGSVCPITPPG